MDDRVVREMVHVRHELRRLRDEGRGDEARPWLERLRALAERDPDEARKVRPELLRWQVAFGF